MEIRWKSLWVEFQRSLTNYCHKINTRLLHLIPSLREAGVWGIGVEVSLTPPLCYSFLPALFSSSSMGSLLWDTVHDELLQHGSVPPGAVRQEQTAPPQVPHRLQFLPEYLLLCGQLQKPLLAHALHGCSFRRGMSTGCSVETCSAMAFSRGCKGNLCSVTWTTPSPPSLTPASAGLLLTLFLTPLSHSAVQHSPPFLNTLSQRQHHLGCWAQPCPMVGPLKPAGAGRVWHGAAPVSPHRDLPAAPCCQHLGM